MEVAETLELVELVEKMLRKRKKRRRKKRKRWTLEVEWICSEEMKAETIIKQISPFLYIMNLPSFLQKICYSLV